MDVGIGPSATLGPVVARRMSAADAAAALLLTMAVVALCLASAHPGVVLALLVFPIWLVARGRSWIHGVVAALFALALVAALDTRSVKLDPVVYLSLAALFAGSVAAAHERLTRVAASAKEQVRARLLTAKPKLLGQPERLSNRELEVLEMVARGEKNSEIADRFVISENTVKSHVRQLLKKLAVGNRTEAAYRYIELYSHLRPLGGGSAGADAPAKETWSNIGAASALNANVTGVTRDDTVELRLEDGRSLEAPLLDPLRERLEVGSSTIVYFDQQGRAVGWFFPEENLGVDMRHLEL
jgi:DNA-binding CsgD family transcriptional regulator